MMEQWMWSVGQYSVLAVPMMLLLLVFTGCAKNMIREYFKLRSEYAEKK
jgi:hypothetical protein